MYFMNLLESKGIKTQINSNKIQNIDGVETISKSCKRRSKI